MTKLNTLPPVHVNHDGLVPPTQFGGGVLVLEATQSRPEAALVAYRLERILSQVNPENPLWSPAEARRRKVAEGN